MKKVRLSMIAAAVLAAMICLLMIEIPTELRGHRFNIFVDLLHVPFAATAAMIVLGLVHRTGAGLVPMRLAAAALFFVLGFMESLQPWFGRDGSWLDVYYDLLGVAAVWGYWEYRTRGRPVPGAAGLLFALLLLPIPVEKLVHLHAAEQAFPVLEDFREGWRKRYWETTGIVTVSRDQGLEIASDGTEPFPGLFLGHPVQDWTGFEALVLDLKVKNPVAFTLRVDDRVEPDGYNDRFQEEYQLAPGDHRLCIPVDRFGRTSGGRRMSLKSIIRMGLFFNRSDEHQKILLQRLALQPMPCYGNAHEIIHRHTRL